MAVDTARVLGQPYRQRVLDEPLRRSLAAAGAVVIEGARAIGKTTTGLNAAASFAFLDDPEVQQLVAIAPSSVLDGATPRLLDEWQLSPQLWNQVRRAVDASPQPGLFILTGSAIPADDMTRHTGAGRFLRLRQRTMSWWEKLVPGPASVSLASLFDGAVPTAVLDDAPSLDDVIDGVLRPGFPALIDRDLDQSAALLRA